MSDSADGAVTLKPCAAALAITGLVAYLPLDEGSGTVTRDQAPVRHDAELSGASWVAGRIGMALAFDAASDFAALAPGLDDLRSLTVCAWIRTETATGPYGGSLATLIDKTQMGGVGWSLHLRPSGTPAPGWRIAFYTNDDDIAGGGIVPIATWTHVCAAWDGASATTGVSLYVNGVVTAPAGSINNGGTPNSDAGIPVRLGSTNRPYDSDAFAGTIDEVVIYDHALDAPEIAAIYQCAK